MKTIARVVNAGASAGVKTPNGMLFGLNSDFVWCGGTLKRSEMIPNDF